MQKIKNKIVYKIITAKW